MTAYTFASFSSNFFVDWSDPTSWSGTSVPNSVDADITIPVITTTATGQAVSFGINIQSGQSFITNSVTQNSDTLELNGSLSVKSGYLLNAAILLGGGTLSVGSVRIAASGSLGGYGNVVSTGAVVSAGSVGTSYQTGSLAITTDTFQNTGVLYSTTTLTLTTTHTGGGFANLVAGVLTGGSYQATGGVITFNVGGIITTDAANIVLGNGTINTIDSATGNTVSLQSSLTTIAPAGTLSLQGGSYTTSNALNVQGTLALSGTSTLSAGALTIAPGGNLSFSGSISSADITTTGGIIFDNGVITASPIVQQFSLAPYANSYFYIGQAVTGSGSIVIGPGVHFPPPGVRQPTIPDALATIELAGAVSTHVVFSNDLGALVLDAPQTFTGTIDGYVHGDTVALSGISVSSISSSSYTGTITGGILKLNAAGSSYNLAFSGNHTIGDFSLSAGAQALSTSPASVLISFPGQLTAAQAIASYQANALTTPTQVQDSAVNVAGNIDGLQTAVAAAKISAITLSDSGVPLVTISANQLNSDAAALNAIASSYTLAITGAPSASQGALSFSTSAPALSASQSIATQLFLTYLGRPVGQDWVNLTANYIAQVGVTPALLSSFASASVGDGVIAATATLQTEVNQTFLNIFGFAATPFEQQAWANTVTSGATTAASLPWVMFVSYLGATDVPFKYQNTAQTKLIVESALTFANASSGSTANYTNQELASLQAAMDLQGTSLGAEARSLISAVSNNLQAHNETTLVGLTHALVDLIGHM